jgi:phage tail sheath protein FI
VATYLSPGVYIEEVSTGPKPIAGVPTGAAAIVGKTERGPQLDPTRLSNWQGYLSTFGGFVDGSATAESAYGFFENGGTTLWVVRADDGSLSRWSVLDGTNTQAFVIEAESPGAWSAGMSVGVFRDTSGGRGSLWSASLTADTPNFAGGEQKDVQIDSTAGVLAGMRVRVADTLGTTFDADVIAVGTNKLTLKRTGAGAGVSVKAGAGTGDGRVLVVHRSANATLALKSGSGFANHDIVRALQPDGTSRFAAVDQARNIGAGMELTLSQTFGGDVPALQFGPRAVALAASIAADDSSISFSDLGFTGGPPGVTSADMIRLVAPSGDEATWSAGSFSFDVPVPAGPVSVYAKLNALPYEETISPGVVMTNADIAARFGFLPIGAKLDIEADGTTYTITRKLAAPGFDPDGGTPGGPFDSGFVQATVTEAAWVPAATQDIVVQAASPPQEGDYLDLGAGGSRLADTVEEPPGIPAYTYLVHLTAVPAAAPTGARYAVSAWQATQFQTLRFGISASLALPSGETMVESYGGLSFDTGSPRYYATDAMVNDVSRLIRVGPRTAASALTSIDSLPVTTTQLQAGSAGNVTGALLKKGIDALEQPLEPAIVACPDVLQLADEVDQADVLTYLIGHAEDMRRFAVIDLPDEPDDEALLAFRQEYLDSTYAAAYAPFVTMVNPRPQPLTKTIDVPPSGFVMGVYARTDDDRGVWKAPANERVSGIVGLSERYTKGRQDFLNPKGVNLIRSFPGRGTRIWGARNLTDDTEWRYVNVRRLFLYLENSIDGGTQWVVFEPNDANTWMRVRVSVENFLNQVWRAGGLAGATPEEAYRVRVGLGVTMTETDIDLGLLIIEVAAAPVKPAEFVVFRISHKRLTE